VAREAALERDEVCQHCGAVESTRKLDVHHIIPVRRFRRASDVELSAAHALGNLVVLCARCHPKADHGDLAFESTLDDPQSEQCE
jgi:5-methylcytosine-specific restriction endonuclease McrA